MKQRFDSTDGFCKGPWPQPVGVMGFVHESKGLPFDIRGNHNFARAFSIGDVAQGRPKAPFDIIQNITFSCWNLAPFFCSSLNYCLV